MQPYEPGAVAPPSRPARPAPAPAPQWQRPVAMTDQRNASGVVVAIAWVSAVLTFAYMLPWAIAVTRGRSNMAGIGVLNLLLGWSLIGWIVALAMACQSHAPLAAMPPVNVVVAQQFPQPAFRQAQFPQPAFRQAQFPQAQFPQPQFGGPVPPAASQPAAGWYPSPDGESAQYWDGQAWTGHRAP